MLRHIGKLLTVCLILAVLTLLSAIPALAFDARGGDTIVIADTEVVKGDLYLAGRSIVVNGTVDGDIFGVAQTVTVNGEVNGGISFAAQTVTINGSVVHGARLAGQSIYVNGDIGRDLAVAGYTLNVASGVTIAGDIRCAVQSVLIDGHVNGNIKGNAGDVIITDEVEGNIELVVDRLTVASTAKIHGDLTYTSEKEAEMQSGAQLAGKVAQLLPEAKKPARVIASPFFDIGRKVLGLLMIFVIGLVAVLAASRRTMSLAESIRTKPWQSLGWGALILFATPIAAILVMITVIGIPAGLIGLVLYGIAIYLSQIPVALLIGRLVIRQDKPMESRGLMVGALALGLVILLLLRLVPFIGWLVSLLTIIFGLGSILVLLSRPQVKQPQLLG